MTTIPQSSIAPDLLFRRADQLNRDSSADLAIWHGIQDTADEWNACIARDLETKLIDDLYPCLWLVARKEGAHIDALHQHLIKKRTIVIAEDPKLHLVRDQGTVYIKPLPDYLLNHAVWTSHIPRPIVRNRLRYDKYGTAVGFLRSYGVLIRHESDFVLAQKANLLPKYVSFQRFQRFIRPFRVLHDEDVSHRYQYGQFRLTRLNWAVRIVHIIQVFHPVWTVQAIPWSCHEEIWQTAQVLQKYAAPLFFVFAMMSLILSSMQVVLAALGTDTWKTFVVVCWGFSVATIIFTTVPVVGAFVVVLVVLTAQAQFAIRMRWKAARLRHDVEGHGARALT